MILGLPWAQWLIWLLATFFVLNGIMHWFNPESVRRMLARWGCPSWFSAVNGTVQVAIGLLLFSRKLETVGFFAAVAFCLAFLGLLLRHGAMRYVPAPLLLLAVVALAWWGCLTS